MANEGSVTHLKLLSSRDEVGNVRTFIFETGGLSWTAGQCQGYMLPQAGETEDENQRWFTIASAPSEGEIHISTRVSQSKFKQTLNYLRPGDEIQALGPEGDFTWEDEPSEPVVLVAGGIGITPFRSFLAMRDAQGKNLPATLLYFNRTHEVPFESALKVLEQKHPEFKVEIIVGQDVTVEMILKLAPQAQHQTVYVSGAEPMVKAVGSGLVEHGVVVKQDEFPGYDEKSY